jgi:hypothetical protein
VKKAKKVRRVGYERTPSYSALEGLCGIDAGESLRQIAAGVHDISDEEYWDQSEAQRLIDSDALVTNEQASSAEPEEQARIDILSAQRENSFRNLDAIITRGQARELLGDDAHKDRLEKCAVPRSYKEALLEKSTEFKDGVVW